MRKARIGAVVTSRNNTEDIYAAFSEFNTYLSRSITQPPAFPPSILSQYSLSQPSITNSISVMESKYFNLLPDFSDNNFDIHYFKRLIIGKALMKELTDFMVYGTWRYNVTFIRTLQ